MKKLLLILILLPLFSYSQFNDGYRDGWEKGYCYGKTYGCIAPIPPIPPIPNLTEGEDFTYKSGYSRGLLDGKAANSGGNSSRSKGVDWSKQYEYAPGGAKSQQMTNEAIDRALSNRRRSSNRSNSNNNNSSGSRSNASSMDYSLYNSGAEKHKAKDYEGAIKDFTAYIQKYPNDGDGWSFRGSSKSWLNDFSGACYDWKRAADLGSESGQKSLLKNCNLDGTPKDISNSSLGGNSLWMPASDLEDKLVESLSNAVSSFKNLADRYQKDAENQTVEINEIRQKELQEFKDCIESYKEFCIDFLNKYAKKPFKYYKDFNGDGFPSYEEFNCGNAG